MEVKNESTRKKKYTKPCHLCENCRIRAQFRFQNNQFEAEILTKQCNDQKKIVKTHFIFEFLVVNLSKVFIA